MRVRTLRDGLGAVALGMSLLTACGDSAEPAADSSAQSSSPTEEPETPLYEANNYCYSEISAANKKAARWGYSEVVQLTDEDRSLIIDNGLDADWGGRTGMKAIACVFAKLDPLTLSSARSTPRPR